MAHLDGRIIGVCLGHVRHWWSGEEFFLDEMYVVPDVQRQGVGGFLMTEMEKKLRAAGVRRIILLTSGDTAADAFYRKHGFQPNARLVFLKKELD